MVYNREPKSRSQSNTTASRFVQAKTIQKKTGPEVDSSKLAMPDYTPLSADWDASQHALLKNRMNVEPTTHSAPSEVTPKRPSEATTLPVQPKLVLGAVGDQYEQEADAMAKLVVKQFASDNPPPLSRHNAIEYAQRKPQTTYTNTPIEAGVESAINQTRGGGRPLAETFRTPMQQAFGADFSGVRVHTDAQADHINQSIQARAFTTGQDIYFRQGTYNPGSRTGQELIAHELTHVVQQVPGRVLAQRLTNPTITGTLNTLPPTTQGIIQRTTIRDAVFNQLKKTPSSVIYWGVGRTAREGAEIAAPFAPYLIPDKLTETAYNFISDLTIQTLSLVTDIKSISSWAGYSNVAITAIVLLKKAYTLWESIPPAIKTLMAYVVGSILTRIAGEKAIPDILVTHNNDPSYLERSIEYLGNAVAWANGMANQLIEYGKETTSHLLSGGFSYVTSGAKDIANFLISYRPDHEQEATTAFVSGFQKEPIPEISPKILAAAERVKSKLKKSGEKSENHSSNSTLAEKSVDTQPLNTIKLPPLTLMLHDMVNKRTADMEEGQLGGLILTAGFGLNLFKHDLYDANKNNSLKITFPWGFDVPTVELLGKIPLINSVDVGLFAIEGFGIKSLKISNEGLEKAAIEMKTIRFGEGIVTLTQLSGTWEKNKGIEFKGGAAIHLPNVVPVKTGVSLKLSSEGKFEQGCLEQVDIANVFTMDQSCFTASDSSGVSLEIKNARLKPSQLFGFGIKGMTLNQLRIERKGIKTAEGTVTLENIPIFKIFQIYDANGTVFYDDQNNKFDIKRVTAKLGAKITLPGMLLPLWPLEINVFFPIVPGLEVTGGLTVGGGVSLKLEGKILWENTDSRWTVGEMKGDGRVKLYAEVGAGLGVGSGYIVSVSGQLYGGIKAEGKAGCNIKGDISHSEGKGFRNPNIQLGYNLDAALKAQIGAKVKGTALYLFNKTFYKVNFKEFTLGQYQFNGSTSLDNEGKLKKVNHEPSLIGEKQNRANMPLLPQIQNPRDQLLLLLKLASDINDDKAYWTKIRKEIKNILKKLKKKGSSQDQEVIKKLRKSLKKRKTLTRFQATSSKFPDDYIDLAIELVRIHEKTSLEDLSEFLIEVESLDFETEEGMDKLMFWIN